MPTEYEDTLNYNLLLSREEARLIQDMFAMTGVNRLTPDTTARLAEITAPRVVVPTNDGVYRDVQGDYWAVFGGEIRLVVHGSGREPREVTHLIANPEAFLPFTDACGEKVLG